MPLKDSSLSLSKRSPPPQNSLWKNQLFEFDSKTKDVQQMRSVLGLYTITISAAVPFYSQMKDCVVFEGTVCDTDVLNMNIKNDSY